MNYDDYDFIEDAERAEMIQDDLRAEIAKLRADVAEAKEIIRAFLEDYPEDEERDIQRRFADAMDVRDASTIDVVSPKVRRARAFLSKS